MANLLDMANPADAPEPEPLQRSKTWAPDKDSSFSSEKNYLDSFFSSEQEPMQIMTRLETPPMDRPTVASSFDDSAVPPYKTESFWPRSWDPDDEAAEPKVTASEDFITKAQEFENLSAQLQAEAQRCRDMAQMQAYAEAAAGLGQFPGGYNPMMPPMMPGMFMPPWQQAGEMPPMMAPSQGARKASSGPGAVGSSAGKTTVMWRNLPNNYTRDGLLELVDELGFEGAFDFFYSPIDFTSNALVGYAFVNFVSTAEADRFYNQLHGFTQWTLKSEKVSEVTWSHPLQGLAGHIDRYRNSPVMHADVSDENKPVLMQDGKRIVFPEPTKKIRAPHLKDCRPKE